MNKALILVDIQNDFTPTGALPVPRGDEVVPIANHLQEVFHDHLVVATLDWHPTTHQSFAAQHAGRSPYDTIELHGIEQVLWPEHCIEFTYGASFARGLDVRRVRKVFTKGTDPELDSYSGFFDNARRHSTGLAEWLHDRGVREVGVLGLATDFCVQATVMDSLSLGFSTTIFQNGCRAVEVVEGDGARAIDAMARAGARVSSLV